MKTSEIKVMVEPEIKKKLRAKAEELGLSVTTFIEKIAAEHIIFLDDNLKSFVKLIPQLFPNSK